MKQPGRNSRRIAAGRMFIFSEGQSRLKRKEPLKEGAMSTGQQDLSLPLSPNYPQEVRKQWERFVSGELIEADKIRPLVRTSWQRCRESGLDPFHLSGPRSLSDAELVS